MATEFNGDKLYTKEEVYRIVANFALSINTEAWCGNGGTTTELVKELKDHEMLDFNVEERVY